MGLNVFLVPHVVPDLSLGFRGFSRGYVCCGSRRGYREFYEVQGCDKE